MKQKNYALNIKYLDNLQQFRPFLHIISYGCHPRQFILRAGITPRTYDDYKRRIELLFPDDVLQINDQGKMRFVSFFGDRYRQQENYFSSIYRCKNLQPKYCYRAIAIIQRLQHANAELSRTELLDFLAGSGRETDNWADTSPSTLNRQLDDLADLGLITAARRERTTVYRAAKDPLAALTTDEKTELLAAVEFYKHVAPVTFPGYELSSSLRELYLLPPSRRVCQFKNERFVHILDDDIILELSDYIAANAVLNITYLRSGKETHYKLQPLRLTSDSSKDCRHLVLRTRRGRPQRLQVNCITKISPAKTIWPPCPPPPAAKTKKLTVNFTDCPETIYNAVVQKLRVERLAVEITPLKGGAFDCRFTLAEPLKLAPLLRLYLPYIAAISDRLLAERLKQDLEEALAAYDIALQ